MNYITTHAESGNSLRNEVGTTDRSCTCGSWLEHWKNYTGASTTPLCTVSGCNEIAIVGAHVKLHRLEAQKGKSYIAPMCATHNGKRGEALQSKPGIRLARGNVEETCGQESDY